MNQWCEFLGRLLFFLFSVCLWGGGFKIMNFAAFTEPVCTQRFLQVHLNDFCRLGVVN